MRKFTYFIVMLSIVIMMASVASAQEDTTDPNSLISDGCAAVDAYTGATSGTTFDVITAQEFVRGDYAVFTITVDGPAIITLTVNGSPAGEVLASDAGDYTLGYYFKATGDYTITIDVVEASATDLGSECYEGKPQICHIPPGNPNAAHTIEIGGPALKAHLAHGDSIGECPMGVESEFEDSESGLIFVTIEEDGLMQIFENCDVECELVAEIEFLNLEAVEGGEFVFDDDPTDDWVITVYFLSVYNEDINIFQVNVEKDGELVADKLLLFVDNDGNVVAWSTHANWEDAEDLIALMAIIGLPSEE